MPAKTNNQETGFSIDCNDLVHVVEFCPFDWSSQLLAFATGTRVTVGTCQFADDNPEEIDGVEFTHLRDFHHGPRVVALAWNPETTLLTVPKTLKFCTAGSDRKLRIFSSDLKAWDNVKVWDGHTDYINDVTFDPDKGESVVSVSDDHTCRVWNTDGTQRMCLPLSSPGMAVRWHQQDPMKILVAEKRGVISLFNALTQQPIMSLEAGHTPLLSADWCHGNVLKVAAVAGTETHLFDTSRSSRALEARQHHTEGGREVQWSRSNEHLLASVGSPGGQVRVYNSKTNQMLLSVDLQVASGVSWHHRLPIVAVGGDHKVHLWPMDQL